MRLLLLIPVLVASAWGQGQIPTTVYIQGSQFAASNTCIDTGSTDAYLCSLTTTTTAYVIGQVYRFRANTANIGAATLNLNSYGPKAIHKPVGGVDTDLDTNDIRSGQWVNLVWDGTNFQMLSQLGNAPSVSLPVGLITLSLTSACPSGFSEIAALSGKFLQGTSIANGDAGTTGGNSTVTPSGTVSQPTFTGAQGTVPAETFTGSSAISSATSAGTPSGTNSTASFTPTGTIAWPLGVPTFTGTPFTSVINHTHSISIVDPGHTHTQIATTYVPQVQGGTTASTTGTHIMTSTATGGSLRSAGETTVSKADTEQSAVTGVTATESNPVGGVASITPIGVIAWPAGLSLFAGSGGTVPAETFTGSALGTHTHTLTATGTNSTANFTPAGTVSQPTFTGAAIDPRPLYTKVIFCSKN